MNIPDGEPVSEYGRAIMDAGKAIEAEYVSRWEEDGVLLSRPPTDKYQTGFTDELHWLTGNLDAVIRPPGWNRGHVVEVKSKDHAAIDAMRAGLKSYDEGHYFQLQTYLGFLQTQTDDLYADYWKRTGLSQDGNPLDGIVNTGSILYVSRDRPRHTQEFTFDFEPSLFEAGLLRLEVWKDRFIDGTLPPRDPNWKWLDQPCKYCPVKRICKADDKQGKLRLSDSTAIATASATRSNYDYVLQRRSVLKRWGVEDAASTDAEAE